MWPAVALKSTVILSAVGVEMAANGPTIDSLQAVVPDVQDTDRSAMNALADTDPKPHATVKATGTKETSHE